MSEILSEATKTVGEAWLKALEEHGFQQVYMKIPPPPWLCSAIAEAILQIKSPVEPEYKSEFENFRRLNAGLRLENENFKGYANFLEAKVAEGLRTISEKNKRIEELEMEKTELIKEAWEREKPIGKRIQDGIQEAKQCALSKMQPR